MTQETGGTERAQEIRQSLDQELIETAEAAEVDVGEVIQSTIETDGDFGNSTVLRFVRSELKRQVEAQNAESYRGLIMGSRDRHGRNWPRRHSLIRSSGDHLEVSSWDGSLPTDGGQEVQIPTGGAAVTLQCEYDSEYDSYQAKGISDIQGVPRSDMLDALGSVAAYPDELSATDEYEVVVVEGVIHEVGPQTIFVDGEPDHDGPILMEDERGEMRPHLEISLDRENGAYVRAHFERQGYGRPYIDVPDFDALVERGFSQYDDPEDQAGFVSKGLEGAKVYVVGNVNSFNQDRDGDGNPVNYINVGMTAIVAADPSEDQAEATESAESDGDVEDEADDELGDFEPEPEAEPEKPGAVAEVRETIEQYADVTGTDMADLTVADVQENLDVDADEPQIRAALSGESAGEETDEFAALKDGDSYNCPECELFQAGSIGELAGHISDEHDPDMVPREWLRDRA